MDYIIKEMSIDNLDLIAEGGMGKIYRINDEQILKVFNNITLEELEKQKTSAVEVLKTMVPTAISFEMVKVGDKYGINHEFLAKQPKNLLKSTCLTPKLAKQVAKITRSTYFEAMDIKAEKQYKKLMSGFVPFLLVLNLGRLGDKAEYMSKFSLFLLLHFFLPVLRLKKRSFIRDLEILKYESGD